LAKIASLYYAILKAMKKKNSGIPENVLLIFEGIVDKYKKLGFIG